MKKSIIFLILILSLTLVSAQDFPSYTNTYVNDFAHILTSEQSEQLFSLFDTVKQQSTAEVVFVSINSTSPYTPQEYRTLLFNEWKIGNKDNDNGLLILYSVQEKRIEVEVGYGLEGILPDSKIGRFLDQNYVPLRDAGKTNEGILAFSNVIAQEIINNKKEVISGTGNKSFSMFYIILFFFILFFILALIIYPFMSRKRKGFGDFMAFFFIDFLVRMIIYSTLLRGGRSSGGGGGGFGGGSSGGGGAGR